MSSTLSISKDRESIKKLLEAYFQSGNLNFLIGSGASMPAIPLAGGIEAEIDALLKAGKEAEADEKALTFIESIENHDAAVQLGIADEASEKTLSNYKSFLMFIDKVLFERRNILLARQANVFTTNYDLFVERAATSIPTVHLNDGFVRTASLNDAIVFSPDKYFDRIYRTGLLFGRQAEVPTINLMKLHGSLNWRHATGEIRCSTNTPKHLKGAERQDPKIVRNALSVRGVILPNLRKYQSTLLERVYYDLLRMFSNLLERENALLIAFGFSFSDEHILDITRRGLRNPTAQLFIFSHSNVAKTQFEDKFGSNRNVTIIVPGDNGLIDFFALNQILSNLFSASGT